MDVTLTELKEKTIKVPEGSSSGLATRKNYHKYLATAFILQFFAPLDSQTGRRSLQLGFWLKGTKAD